MGGLSFLSCCCCSRYCRFLLLLLALLLLLLLLLSPSLSALLWMLVNESQSTCYDVSMMMLCGCIGVHSPSCFRGVAYPFPLLLCCRAEGRDGFSQKLMSKV